MKAKIGVALCLCVLVVGGWLTFAGMRPTAAAEKAPEPAAQAGRYQLSGDKGYPSYLVDTATGTVWTYDGDKEKGQWKLRCPPPKD
jgi:hypothetical protein